MGDEVGQDAKGRRGASHPCAQRPLSPARARALMAPLQAPDRGPATRAAHRPPALRPCGRALERLEGPGVVALPVPAAEGVLQRLAAAATPPTPCNPLRSALPRPPHVAPVHASSPLPVRLADAHARRPRALRRGGGRARLSAPLCPQRRKTLCGPRAFPSRCRLRLRCAVRASGENPAPSRKGWRHAPHPDACGDGARLVASGGAMPTQGLHGPRAAPRTAPWRANGP